MFVAVLLLARWKPSLVIFIADIYSFYYLPPPIGKQFSQGGQIVSHFYFEFGET